MLFHHEMFVLDHGKLGDKNGIDIYQESHPLILHHILSHPPSLFYFEIFIIKNKNQCVNILKDRQN